jgi:hypothetical protein
MSSNTASGANTIGVVNTVSSDARVVVVTSPTSNSWQLKAISVENLLANSDHDVKAANLQLAAQFTPANSTANCIQGQLFYDNNYFYIAVSNNVFRRVAHSSF